MADSARAATVILQDPALRRRWWDGARRAKRWLWVVLGLGLLLLPYLSGAIADGLFEPKRSRRLFGRDRVTRDERAEGLDATLQWAFWILGLGLVLREAWRERPAPVLADGLGDAVVSGPPPDPQGPAVSVATSQTARATLPEGNRPHAPPAPMEQARYRIDAELGRGGMGVVYRATDTVLDRAVALKSLPAELLTREELVQRFRREAKVLASLAHPHIVNVHDLVLQQGQLFMAMELVEGRDLSSLLEERGKLTEAEAVAFALQTARALAYAHAQGIIHRDFKPDNVLVANDGTAKVTDFGLARAQSGPRMTQTGAVMGTPYYMSPEQSSGDEVDARTDLYALGATLYELLTGEPPFVGNTAQLLIAHISQPVPPLRERAPHVSEALAGLVHALLEKKREDRPADMAAVVQRLEALTAPSAASA